MAWQLALCRCHLVTLGSMLGAPSQHPCLRCCCCPCCCCCPQLTASGYNHKLPLLVGMLVDALAAFEVKPDR
jgi:hypothetical protein